MFYNSVRRIMNAVTWLLIAYLSYVFLRNVGVTPLMVLDEMHKLATTLFVSVGF